jgi:hypothetical protein
MRVATTEPIVAGYAVTRWKIAGAIALGTSAITALGWIALLFASKIVAWLVSHLVFDTQRVRARPIAPGSPWQIALQND